MALWSLKCADACATKYYRASWETVLERGLLEQFAASHKGRLPADAPAQFAALARQQGVAEVDAERLAEILGPLFACQKQVLQAEQAVIHAKQQLQQDATRLSGPELAQRAERISELEKSQQGQQLQVRVKIEELLADELQSWQKKQDSERKKQEAERQGQEAKRLAERQRQATLQAAESQRPEVERPAKQRNSFLLLVGLMLSWLATSYILYHTPERPVLSPQSRRLAEAARAMREASLATYCKATLSGHSGSVSTVAFSADRKTLASGSSDKTIKLWNLSTGENTATLSGHRNDVNAVAFSADGKTLASGSFDDTIKLWTLPSR